VTEAALVVLGVLVGHGITYAWLEPRLSKLAALERFNRVGVLERVSRSGPRVDRVRATRASESVKVKQ
jgi:hypothetical protein